MWTRQTRKNLSTMTKKRQKKMRSDTTFNKLSSCRLSHLNHYLQSITICARFKRICKSAATLLYQETAT
jgi:hypothetical protein